VYFLFGLRLQTSVDCFQFIRSKHLTWAQHVCVLRVHADDIARQALFRVDEF
jgi:hypothetical protein